MKTAIDSSVVFAVLKRETGWERWSQTIREAVVAGPVDVCPVVFAELSAGFSSATQCRSALELSQIGYSHFAEDAAWLAGRTFAEYRSLGGPREHLIPVFLVGAHAMVQCDRLAAIDRGYLRRRSTGATRELIGHDD